MMRRRLAGLFACLAMLLAAPARPTENPTPVKITPAEHVRTPDQTFLTFPEWYLVHSPAEYAAYLARTDRPSRFPLFSHIGQFWQSYAAVSHEIEKYPFNGGYHLMVMVIGVSTTVEYSLKGLYERTVGRLAEASKSSAPVPEEQFAARFAQSYVDFIRVEPWYKFDFWRQLKSLWADAPFSGPNLLRRWERRFALTSELLVKEGYARLIKLALNRAATPDPAHYPDYRVLDDQPVGGAVLATIPRYEGFTTYSRWLAGQGIDFKEVAGNNGEIVVSVLVPDDWNAAGVRKLFEQPILTQHGRRRVVFATPVGQLGAELRRAQAAGGQVQVEHIYDF